MRPSALHYGGLFLTVIGVLMMIADKAQVIPGDVGFYSGAASVLLGAILHAFNTANMTSFK